MLRFDGKKDPERRAAVEANPAIEMGINMPFGVYRKTAMTYAARIDEPFEVDTLEGLHSGNAGDYLAIGPHGEMYPIDASVFRDSYEIADDTEGKADV